MKSWLQKLYHQFLRDLAGYVAYEMQTLQKFEAWRSKNATLIAKNKAIAHLNGSDHIPTDKEIYNEYRNSGAF